MHREFMTFSNPCDQLEGFIRVEETPLGLQVVQSKMKLIILNTNLLKIRVNTFFKFYSQIVFVSLIVHIVSNNYRKF